jgi:hypothetical protein
MKMPGFTPGINNLFKKERILLFTKTFRPVNSAGRQQVGGFSFPLFSL